MHPPPPKKGGKTQPCWHYLVPFKDIAFVQGRAAEQQMSLNILFSLMEFLMHTFGDEDWLSTSLCMRTDIHIFTADCTRAKKSPTPSKKEKA